MSNVRERNLSMAGSTSHEGVRLPIWFCRPGCDVPATVEGAHVGACSTAEERQADEDGAQLMALDALREATIKQSLIVRKAE